MHGSILSLPHDNFADNAQEAASGQEPVAASGLSDDRGPHSEITIWSRRRHCRAGISHVDLALHEMGGKVLTVRFLMILNPESSNQTRPELAR